ncbi:MAG TPA: OmpA family protein [Steroidobacteraceae bacterium]|nr:OmpA family protein [Steroidobacteraceae bacterium]
MITRNLRHAGLGLAAAACLGSSAAWAGTDTGPDSNARAEDIGIVTGLAVGAAAGGPIGAVIGAAAGGLMGDRYHKSEAERARLAANLTELNGSLTESRSHGAQLEHTLSAVDAVGMDVSFRTDDVSIKVEDMGPLLKLGALAATVPDAKLRVAGFADPRGAAAYNEDLSQRRAEAVAAALVCGGMSRERLIIEAHGASESTSAAGDLDAYALDRRVTVRLERGATAAPAVTAAAGQGAEAPGGGQ